MSYTLEVWTSTTPRAWTQPEYEAHVSCSDVHEDGPHATREDADAALDRLDLGLYAVEVFLRRDDPRPRWWDRRDPAHVYLATFRRNAAGELVNVANPTGGAL